mgnify:CR=1 FL=1
MATEVNIADMNSIPEIYLWVPTTLPISIYTPSLMIYLNNVPIYIQDLFKKAFWEALISDFWPKSACINFFTTLTPYNIPPFKNKNGIIFFHF